MVICNFEYCRFNKEHFCTRENTIIKNANGFPACEILVNRNGTIGSNDFVDRKTRDIIIEEEHYEQITEDIAGSRETNSVKPEETVSNIETTDSTGSEEMFDS